MRLLVQIGACLGVVLSQKVATPGDAGDWDDRRCGRQRCDYRTCIGAIERNAYDTSLDLVDRLAKALGVGTADLLARPRRRSPPSPGRRLAKLASKVVT